MKQTPLARSPATGSPRITTICLATILSIFAIGSARADDPVDAQPPAPASAADLLPETPAWQIPTAEALRPEVFDWLNSGGATPETLEQAERIWSPEPPVPDPVPPVAGDVLLDRIVRVVALVDTDARGLVDRCRTDQAEPPLPDVAWFERENTPAWLTANMRLFFARWLIEYHLYDEAAKQLDTLTSDDVADPAGLLFSQAVVHQRLLDREQALAAVERLQDGPGNCPRRYLAVAALLEADLAGLTDDASLGHIARRMEDVQRRLSLSRANQKVRGIQDGIIESLDELIKKAEEAAAKAAQSQSIQSSSPAQRSTPMGGKGSGRVAKRSLGTGSGWGDLPPKEREEALQHIGRQLPAHYRDVIEQYFRRIAAEEESP